MSKEQLPKTLEDIIREIVKEEFEKLVKDDLNKIVDALLPEIEKLVARVVTKHIRSISSFVLENFDKE